MWRNNYLEKQKQRQSITRRIKFYSLAGGLLLLAALFWGALANLPLFKITNFEVRGLTIFTPEDFINNLKPANILGSDNFWAWPSQSSYQHPALARIGISKNFWEKKIVLDIKERERFGIWCAEKNCFWFDREGVFFSQAPDTTGYLIYRVTGPRPKVGMENIVKALALLERYHLGADSVTYNEKLQELEVATSENARIIFSTRFDQSSSLATAYEAIIKKIGLRQIQYLDLTVENRIYYK